MKVKEIYDYLDSIAPFSTAAPWDNCGLSVGSLDYEVSKILISLDVTSEVIDYAEKIGAELVITHHPLIFNPLKSALSDSLVYKAVKSGITFISSHTCLDKAEGGVNDCLALALNLKNTYSSEIDEFLKLGEIDSITPTAFAELVKEKLNANVMYVDCEKPIKKVAFCSGSGGDLYEAALLEGADALLTGEAKYHDILNAKHYGLSVFAAGHFETEVIVCESLKNRLQEKFKNLEVEVFKAYRPIKYI